jgi:hypothetical protein
LLPVSEAPGSVALALTPALPDVPVGAAASLEPADEPDLAS